MSQLRLFKLILGLFNLLPKNNELKMTLSKKLTEHYKILILVEMVNVSRNPRKIKAKAYICHHGPWAFISTLTSKITRPSAIFEDTFRRVFKIFSVHRVGQFSYFSDPSNEVYI